MALLLALTEPNSIKDSRQNESQPGNKMSHFSLKLVVPNPVTIFKPNVLYLQCNFT